MSGKTKFDGEDIISATDFGKLIDCSLNAVKKMIDDRKLTEGVSYLRERNKILISVPHAKEELRACTNPKTAKNPKLLEFLELDLPRTGLGFGGDDINNLTPSQVLDELRKSELRISLMEERIMDQKYVDRKVVEMNLEAIGIEFRDALTGFSSRITPQMRAAYSDHEAEVILYAAIEEILLKISSLGEKDIASPK